MYDGISQEDDATQIKQELEFIRTKINSQLRPDVDIKIYAKLNWLSNYFNNVAKEYGVEEIKTQ